MGTNEDVWEKFEIDLEMYTQAVGWNEKEKMVALPALLDDLPRGFLLSHAWKDRNTWRKCLGIMRKRWDWEKVEESIWQKFYVRKRKPGELLTHFMDDLICLMGDIEECPSFKKRKI